MTGTTKTIVFSLIIDYIDCHECVQISWVKFAFALGVGYIHNKDNGTNFNFRFHFLCLPDTHILSLSAPYVYYLDS